MNIRTMTGLMAAITVSLPAQAATINVPGDQPTIQAAIGVAVNGDEIIVAQGEYLENISFLGKAITVRSMNPTDAGVVLNTIINANGVGRVVTCNNGEGPDTVLSGFVITGGSAATGAGMRNDASSPTVANCTFSSNTAASLGGGMGNFSGSDPTIRNCLFGGNTSGGNGGGMYNSSSNPVLTSCAFNGNSANLGGGMDNSNSSPMLTACTFTANSASLGTGGGINNIGSSPTMIDCSFNGNGASTMGGGMFSTSTSSPTLTNTGFCDNTPDQVDGDPFTDGGGNSMAHCPPPLPVVACIGDLDNDGTVGITDFLALLAGWGSCPP